MRDAQGCAQGCAVSRAARALAVCRYKDGLCVGSTGGGIYKARAVKVEVNMYGRKSNTRYCSDDDSPLYSFLMWR